MEIFPDPLPEGHNNLSLEATSQFLRPDRATSGDSRTHAILDGEEWQLTADLAAPLLGGFINLRLRAVTRSGGIADQAFTSYHDALSIPQGGRNLVPKYQFHYRLERDGVVVVDLKKPDTVLMDKDGMQQYWTVTHKSLPHWRFGISEEIGSYFAPDLTVFASYRF